MCGTNILHVHQLPPIGFTVFGDLVGAGQRVDCSQIAEGVRFLYRPPPKAKAQQDAGAPGAEGPSVGTVAAAAGQPGAHNPTG